MDEQTLAFANRNILYVDDEPGNLRVFKANFDWQYTVFTANSGQEALALMHKEPIQVVIADYKMPEMDGFMLLEIISFKYPDVVRIILSGYADPEIVLEAVNRTGIYRFITKPYEEGQISESLNNALELYRLKQEKAILVAELQDQISTLEDNVAKRTKEINLQKRLLEEEIEKASIRSEELGRAFSIIRTKNQEILDSISYAKTIQQAILPRKEEMKVFGGYFFMYRPRDIVSGDFYWAARLSDTETWVAMVDCSGHGVPGAFMSMIGHTMLNKIIKEQKVSSPARVLAELHREIRILLNQDQEGHSANDDGMDLSLMRFDSLPDQQLSMVYAAAKRPVAIFSKGEKTVLKGSRRSIGGRYYENFDTSDQNVILGPESLLYTWTDGITDQHNFGYKKIGTKYLVTKLEDIKDHPMPIQLDMLEAWLDNHQGEVSQRDDIALMALKV